MNRLTDTQLIAKIKELKQIKPDSSWVVLTKKRIMEKEESGLFSYLFNELLRSERFVFCHKLAFSAATVLIILIGTFGFVLTSMPGDSLFQLKKITEESQSVLLGVKDQPKHNLELANKRLDDLTKIAEKNEINNLAPAINEYQASVTRVAESLAKVDNSYITSELVQDIKKIEEKEKQIKSLGVEIGENQGVNNVLAGIVEREIIEMESKELTEREIEILNNVKSEYEQGNYSNALEILLLK